MSLPAKSSRISTLWIMVITVFFGQMITPVFGQERDVDDEDYEDLYLPPPLPGQGPDVSLLNDPGAWYQFSLVAEKGFIGVLKHAIQFDADGSRFNYVAEGGQDVLFPFERLSAEVRMKERHNLLLLYQPLDIRTQSLLERDVIVDDLTFPAGTAVDLRYGFSFWRLSYLYDFNHRPDKEIAVGMSFQIRNATIVFASRDGTLFRINQNIGPVPIFKFRVGLPLGRGGWWGGEIDGFYADGKYITGSNADFVGAIYDASLRLGLRLKYVDPFLNLRFLGGGARGTENNPQGPGDGYTDNWLHVMSLSVGMKIK